MRTLLAALLATAWLGAPHARADGGVTPYVATVRPLSPAAPQYEYGYAVGNIAIRRIAPIIYTGTDGGAVNEYRVSPNGIEVTIQIADAPENGDLVDVRWEPYDNIGALAAFATIRVDRVDRDHIKLTARSYRDTPNRMRILITAVYGAAQ